MAKRRPAPIDIPAASDPSGWREFLIGALVLSACFLSLCAYAAYQRKDLLEHAPRLSENSTAALRR